MDILVPPNWLIRIFEDDMFVHTTLFVIFSVLGAALATTGLVCRLFALAGSGFIVFLLYGLVYLNAGLWLVLILLVVGLVALTLMLVTTSYQLVTSLVGTAFLAGSVGIMVLRGFPSWEPVVGSGFLILLLESAFWLVLRPKPKTTHEREMEEAVRKAGTRRNEARIINLDEAAATARKRTRSQRS